MTDPFDPFDHTDYPDPKSVSTPTIRSCLGCTHYREHKMWECSDAGIDWSDAQGLDSEETTWPDQDEPCPAYTEVAP